MSDNEIKEILCQQLQLLAEKSKCCSAKDLCALTNAMSTLYLAYLQTDCFRKQDLTK